MCNGKSYFKYHLRAIFDHVGIALATSISAWVSVALLFGALTRRKFLKIDGRLGESLGIFLSSAGMLVVLFFGALGNY